MTNQGKSKKELLAASKDMSPVWGTVDLQVPIDDLWDAFRHANWWAQWNKCFFWAWNRDLIVGRPLIWCFEPIRPWYPYKMPAIAKIVEVEGEGPKRKVTWEVSALPRFYARHTYFMEDLGNGYTRFGSWEKAMGWSFRIMKVFWVNHFVFVKDRSIEGARTMQQVHRRGKPIGADTLPRQSRSRFWAAMVLIVGAVGWLGWALVNAREQLSSALASLAPVLGGVLGAAVVAGVVVGAWFYNRYMRIKPIEMGEGAWAVLGGGGNSLVLEGEKSLMVMDTKFPPASRALRRWIDGKFKKPVSQVLNTHHHYDHTLGNDLYEGATFSAFRAVPEFMKREAPEYWEAHPNAMPSELLGEDNKVEFEGRRYEATHPGPAHTHSDLWIYFPEQDLVFINDLLFHTYYPFMDLNPVRGVDVKGIVRAVREITVKHPEAKYLPGHGPPATAKDARGYADYLEWLYGEIEPLVEKNMTEDEVVAQLASKKQRRRILPSRHATVLPVWATWETNVRFMFRHVSDQQAWAANEDAADPSPPAYVEPTGRGTIRSGAAPDAESPGEGGGDDA